MTEEANALGLPTRWFERVIGLLAANPKVNRVLVFGSRARGDFRPTSDLDLALDAPELTHSEFARLRMEFDELPFILKTDLVWLQDAGESFRANILGSAREAFRREHAKPSCQEDV
jgi:predicted nucleotidyltransferase